MGTLVRGGLVLLLIGNWYNPVLTGLQVHSSDLLIRLPTLWQSSHQEVGSRPLPGNLGPVAPWAHWVWWTECCGTPGPLRLLLFACWLSGSLDPAPSWEGSPHAIRSPDPRRGHVRCSSLPSTGIWPVRKVAWHHSSQSLPSVAADIAGQEGAVLTDSYMCDHMAVILLTTKLVVFWASQTRLASPPSTSVKSLVRLSCCFKSYRKSQAPELAVLSGSCSEQILLSLPTQPACPLCLSDLLLPGSSLAPKYTGQCLTSGPLLHPCLGSSFPKMSPTLLAPLGLSSEPPPQGHLCGLSKSTCPPPQSAQPSLTSLSSWIFTNSILICYLFMLFLICVSSRMWVWCGWTYTPRV